MTNTIYSFNECNKNMENLIGEKGSLISEIKRLNIPAVNGFVLTPEFCYEYNYQDISKNELENRIYDSLINLEEETGKKYGEFNRGFFLEITSGWESNNGIFPKNIWGVGLNDKNVEMISKLKSNPLDIWEEYRKYIINFALYGFNITKDSFRKRIDEKFLSEELSLKDKKTAIEEYKDIIKELTGRRFPQDPLEQVFELAKGLFNRWESLENKVWLVKNNFEDRIGIPLLIKEARISTEYIFMINATSRGNEVFNVNELNLPNSNEIINDELITKKLESSNLLVEKLEKHFRKPIKIKTLHKNDEMLVIDATFYNIPENEKLMYYYKAIKEGIYNPEDIARLISKKEIETIFSKRVAEEYNETSKAIEKIEKIIWPGAAAGHLVYTQDKAMKLINEGRKVIFLLEYLPEKLGFLSKLEGIICEKTFKSKKFNAFIENNKIPCVLIKEFGIDTKNKKIHIGKYQFKEETSITINCANGNIYLGMQKIVKPSFVNEERELLDYLFRPSVKEELYAEITDLEDLKTLKEAEIFGAENITFSQYFNEPEIYRNCLEIVAGTPQEKKAAFLEMKNYFEKRIIKLFEKADGMELFFNLNREDLSLLFPSELELYKDIKISERRYEIEKLKKLEKFSWRKKFIESSSADLGITGTRQLYVQNDFFRAQVLAIFEALKKKSEYKINLGISIGSLIYVEEIEKVIKELENSALEAKWNSLEDTKINLLIYIDNLNILDNIGEIEKYSDSIIVDIDRLIEMYFGVKKSIFQQILLSEYQEINGKRKNIFLEPPIQFINYILKKLTNTHNSVFVKGMCLENNTIRDLFLEKGIKKIIAQKDQIYNLKFSAVKN